MKTARVIAAIAFLARIPDGRAGESSPVGLCEGLTVVTAISSGGGDYESLKTVDSITGDRIRIQYSAEGPNRDIFAENPSEIVKVHVTRAVFKKDLETATQYEQVFNTPSDEVIPGTTAMGISAAMLRRLKTKGDGEIGVSNAYPGVYLTGNREVRPNAYDYLTPIKLHRVGSARVAVLLNDVLVQLPAVHVTGESAGETSEFFFLDDSANPLTLAFRLGINGIAPANAETLELCRQMKDAGSPMRADQCNTGPMDRDTLRVVKITSPCAATIDAIEAALADSGRANVYSIYFTFDSNELRAESSGTLNRIAAILQRHPDWKLSVNGHTDDVASDAYNLELSRKRAEAVKNALVERHGVEAPRLTTKGFGESQPVDTNETLEGRARNRRVELVRM